MIVVIVVIVIDVIVIVVIVVVVIVIFVIVVKGGKQSVILHRRLRTKSYGVGFAQTWRETIPKIILCFSNPLANSITN